MQTRPRLLVAALVATLLAVGVALLAPAGPASAVSLPGMVLSSTTATLPPELAPLATGKRITYVTTDVNGNLIMATGLIMTPKTNKANRVVAWAHGTLGVADICAPSWAGHKPRDATYIQRWLENGFAVVATDYQGLGGPGPHPYLNWEAEGRSVLDAARAALAAYPDKLAHKVFVSGQSQGSGAAIGATRIAPTYQLSESPDAPGIFSPDAYRHLYAEIIAPAAKKAGVPE